MSSPTKLIIQGQAIKANVLLAKTLPELPGPTSNQNQIIRQYYRAKQHRDELVALEQRILDAFWHANEFVRKTIVAQREKIQNSFEEWVNQLRIPELLEALKDKITVWGKRIQILESKMDNDALALFEKQESEEKQEKKRKERNKIRLRYFSGSRDDWIPFWETFNALVHQNNSLTKSEKFDLLERNLEDSAQPLLEWVDRTEEDYDIAIDFLQKMFENEGKWFKSLNPKNLGSANINSDLNIQNAKNASEKCSLVLKVSNIKLRVIQTIKIDERKPFQNQKCSKIPSHQKFQKQKIQIPSSARRNHLNQQILKPSSKILVREKALSSGLKDRLCKYFKAKHSAVCGSRKSAKQIIKAESIQQNQQLFGSQVQNLIEPQNKCIALVDNLHVIEPNEIVQSDDDKGLKNAKLNMKNPVSGTFGVKLMNVGDGKRETNVSYKYVVKEAQLPIKLPSLMEEKIKIPNKFLQKTALVQDKPKEFGISCKFRKMKNSVCDKKTENTFCQENTNRNNELEKYLNYRSEFVSKSNPFSFCLNKALGLMGKLRTKSNKNMKNKSEYNLPNNEFIRKRINGNQFFKNCVWPNKFKIWKKPKYLKTKQFSARLGANVAANAESANELAVVREETFDQNGEQEKEENKAGFLLTNWKKLKESTILDQNLFVSEHLDIFLCHWVCPTTYKYWSKSDKMTKLGLVLNEPFEFKLNNELFSEIICKVKSSLIESYSKILLEQVKMKSAGLQQLKTNSLKEYYSSLIKLSGEVFYGMNVEIKKQKFDSIKAFVLQFFGQKQFKLFDFLKYNLLVKMYPFEGILILFVEQKPLERQTKYSTLLLVEQFVVQRLISDCDHPMALSSKWCQQCAGMNANNVPNGHVQMCRMEMFQMGSVGNERFKWGVLEMSEN